MRPNKGSANTRVKSRIQSSRSARRSSPLGSRAPPAVRVSRRRSLYARRRGVGGHAGGLEPLGCQSHVSERSNLGIAHFTGTFRQGGSLVPQHSRRPRRLSGRRESARAGSRPCPQRGCALDADQRRRSVPLAFSGFPLAVPFPNETELEREAEQIVESA